MDNYLEVLKKYTEFNGRAQRTEYWMFVLFSTIISIVLVFIDMMLGTFNPILYVGLLSGIYALGVFLPSLGVTIRRLHDTDRSGWWFLLAFIPIIGQFALIFFLAQDSKLEQNQYGNNPKQVTNN